jgi:hypothetical protein
MTKKDIVAKLTELGIAFDPKLTAKELEPLLPSIPTSSTPADTETPPVDTPAATPKAEKNSVTVKYLELGTEKERTYSREIHGENFADLAEQFCANPSNKCL